MTNDETKELCLSLLRADSQEDVIAILGSVGFWENPGVWRYFGDREDNYSTIGNQQARPEAALVEKVVNSVDARLMNECQAAGMSPESPEAPQSIRAAVARHFEGREVSGEIGGKIRDWDDKKRREQGRNITIAATGEKGAPCFTIADTGEGQTPDRMPVTILSLDKKNKLRIPFVQGKFNMGGTGVLKFCGKHNLQFVVTRRNPAIVAALCESGAFADHWGFTVVRRENPTGTAKNSVYTYLAPVRAEQKQRGGSVLRFTAATLPLMPQKNEPYKRNVEWGTAIKLYEYHATGFRSQIVRPDGLLYRLQLLLPEVALPVRLHECREYGGDPERSFDTNMNGLLVRLDDGRHANIEPSFPDTVQFQIDGGEKFSARIYAFKKGKAGTYRKNEGIVFTVNGQTHAHLPVSFFGRQKVKMGRLADSILAIVDCTQMSGRAREDLFMNSRDRLSGGDLRASLEQELEEIIRNHEGLKALRERRKREQTEANLAESKPLEDVLKSILRSSPSLSALFLTGRRLSIPHKSKEVASEDKPFVGTLHPTFFRFKGLDYGAVLKRSCPLNRRCRILFETDVVNDYFDRAENPGRFTIALVDGDGADRPVTHSLRLHDGTAALSIRFPEEVKVGDMLRFRAPVEDDTLVEPFVNEAEIAVADEAPDGGGGGSGPKKPPSDKEGAGSEGPLGIELPNIYKVRQGDWEKHGFDRKSAGKIAQDESETDPDRVVYTFYINVDNIYLLTEMKASAEEAVLLEARFVYGLVLIGLAIIRDRIEHDKKAPVDIEGARDGTDEETIENQVARVTKALAPFILPLVQTLGSLADEDVGTLSRVGDDE